MSSILPAVTIVAWEGPNVLGYATCDRGTVRWTRHVAELRVVVAESARGAGVGRLLLVTAHRRESFGRPLRAICQALSRILELYPDAGMVFPVHPNPNVRGPVHAILGSNPRVLLVEPLDYVQFVHVMKRATLILTDSGGVQEEEPSLGKPVLVLRDKTERPEGIEAGVAWLVGTDPDRIVA